MRMRSMKCGGCTNPEISFWTPIVFWTVRFSSWNNLSCFSSLFLLTPLFFEYRENLSVPKFAPRTPFSLRRGSRQLRLPSLCCYFVHKNQEDKTPMPPLLSGIGCSSPSVAASLRLLAPSLHAPLHSVTPSIGCLFPSVASRFRLRLRGTLPHPRILSRVTASAKKSKSTQKQKCYKM